MATIEDFQKLDLRIGEVVTAESVENSEKLIKLSISFGEEKKQIIAGIGKKYNPEDLTGRQFIFVFNLESRVLMGLESQGMILAASDENGPVLLAPLEKVAPGSKIK